ncbi:MAG TPA: hypothetical protein ENN66_08405 [Proteobacteria bacterium]|nr:hypothetical protein [Pseudomonadota bacterium]
MDSKNKCIFLFLGISLFLLAACAGNRSTSKVASEVETEAVAEPLSENAPVCHDREMADHDEAAVFEEFMNRLMSDLQANFLDQELLRDSKRRAETKFLFSAFVGEDDFDQTTAFGRMIGDTLASRMQNIGLQVIEVRLSRSMRIHKKFGMLAMSQDMLKLFDEHQATFMITGSYTITPHHVYVMARVIGNTSQVIYASSGIWLPRSPMVNYLLNFRQPTVKVVAAD